MATPVDPETFKFYQEILSKNGIKGVIRDIEIISPSSLHGKHFASVCEYVTIHLENVAEPIELFAKKVSKSPGHLEMLQEINAFGKEAGFFNHLLKDIQEFYAKQKRLNPHLQPELDIFPKCYYADETLILMENLAKKGFFLLDRREKQDLVSAQTVLRNLAKLHATTYVMQKEIGEADFLEKYPCLIEGMMSNAVNSTMIGSIFETMLRNCVQFLEEVDDVPHKEFALEILSKYDSQRVIRETSAAVERKDIASFCNTVNHGDPWINNIMFRRNPKTNELDHQIFCDFQVIRFGSPTIDISYFLYTSVKPEVRRSNFNLLLKYYCCAFRDFVQDLSDDHFEGDFNTLRQEYNQSSPYAFWFHLMMMTVHDALEGFDMVGADGDFNDVMAERVRKFAIKNPGRIRAVATDIAAAFQEQYGDYTYEQIQNIELI